MTMPGMLDMNQTRKPRRSMRSRFITKMFAVGVAAAMLGAGVAIVQNAPSADAGSQTQVNAYIKSHGGVPPCKHEDEVLKVNGKKVTCVWWAGQRGNGKGDSFLHTANDRYIYITGKYAKPLR